MKPLFIIIWWIFYQLQWLCTSRVLYRMYQNSPDAEWCGCRNVLFGWTWGHWQMEYSARLLCLAFHFCASWIFNQLPIYNFPLAVLSTGMSLTAEMSRSWGKRLVPNRLIVLYIGKTLSSCVFKRKKINLKKKLGSRKKLKCHHHQQPLSRCQNGKNIASN